jgi:cephalosporin-C deacetylase
MKKLPLAVSTLLLSLGSLAITPAPAMTVNLNIPYNTATSGPRSDFPVIFYAPEQPNFLFDSGDHVDIWMQSTNRALKISWGLCRNMVDTPFMTGTVLPAMDESFKISIPTATLLPAFYNLRVKVEMTATKSMDVTSVFGWKVNDISWVNVVPKDFESYWRGEKAKVDATPLDLKCTFVRKMTNDEISAYNVAHAALPEDYDPEGEKYKEIEIYKVDWASANGPGQRTYGWYAKPVGPGPFPTLLVLPGAGNVSRPYPVEHARHGFATLDLNVHNSPADLPWPQYASPAYGAPFTTPDAYWGHQVYLNAMQAVDAIVQLPGADKTKLAVMGGSQGGRATVVVAAMDPRIKAAIPAIAHFDNIPYLSWAQRLNATHDAGFRPFTEKDVVHDDAMRVQSYYDVANFAPWIKCSVLMNAGMIDGASYPMGTFQVFHNITLSKSKKIMPMPNIAHDWSPFFDRYAWRWLDEQLGVPPAPTPPQSTIDLNPKP